jgi:hypothetical protein
MFTIKNKKYALIHNRSDMHLMNDTAGHIILNAANFREDLIAASKMYFDEVETNNNLLNKLWDRFNRDGFLALVPIQVLP